MNPMESAKLLLAASGGDTVKLFDVSVELQNPCVLTYTPSPGFRVNSVKWNHNNFVLASAGEDGKISLRRENGRSLRTVPAKNSSESISTINFSNKGSRYLCSGGSGHVVRIWDLQNERCVKSLKGHTDTITGVMYNCKDEYIASVSRKGDLILHNLASGTKSAELRDPDGQVLGALDYSRTSRHLLVTAGDDGSIHLWDATARSPKVSWVKQHSAPISSVSFSPCNDKVIASVGLDMKLYTFDSGSRKVSSCIAYDYEAPFSSLAITDDGLTLAAGTSTGQVAFYDIRGKPQPITVLRAYGNSEAITDLCWQRSKPTTVNENNCTDKTILLAGDVGDSIVMPDPVPSKASSIPSMSSAVSGSRYPNCSGTSEETAHKTSLLAGVTLKRLQPPRSYNSKDDMGVFSPLVQVQPITPSLDKMWEADSDSKKNDDRKPSLQFSSLGFGLQEDGTNESHSIFDWKSNFSYKQDGIRSTFSQLTSTPSSTYCDDPSSITPPEAWGGDKLSDKCIHHRPTTDRPSRFAALATPSVLSGSILSGLQSSLPTSQTMSSSTAVISVANLHPRDVPSQETSLGSSEAISSPLGTKKNTGQANFDTLGTALSLPRKFSSYAERISASSISDAPSFSSSSPKSKKSGSDSRGEVLNSFVSRSAGTETAGHATTNGDRVELQRNFSESDTQQGTSFTLQLFQHTLEATLSSFQKSVHEDIRNLHIETLRQFHMHETEMSSVMGLILENQAEIMKDLQSLRKETQQIRQLL